MLYQELFVAAFLPKLFHLLRITTHNVRATFKAVCALLYCRGFRPSSYFKRATDRCVTPLVRLIGASQIHACYKNPSQGGDKIHTSSVHICDTLSHIHTCNAVKTMNVSFDIISCIKTVNILCDIISVNTTLKGVLHTNTKTQICG